MRKGRQGGWDAFWTCTMLAHAGREIPGYLDPGARLDCTRLVPTWLMLAEPVKRWVVLAC